MAAELKQPGTHCVLLHANTMIIGSQQQVGQECFLLRQTQCGQGAVLA